MTMAAIVPGNPMHPEPCLVRKIVRETSDTFTLTLEPSRGAEANRFQPGQFSMLWVFGVGEMPISISGDPAVADCLVYTVRSVGQATGMLVSRGVGEAVGVRGPFGTGWPVERMEGRDVVVIAGGIGLAPLRPVVYEVLRNRARYGRLVVLYGARGPRDLLYRRELAAWAREPDTQILVTVDHGGLNWRGHVGVVTRLFKDARLQPARSLALTCGPEIMMRFVARDLEARGMAPGDIYLSMERNMRCAVGFCGHCQYGPHFVCKDGPIFPYDRVRGLLGMYEI